MIIYKYELVYDNITINMPKGGEILTVQNQREGISLWVKFDESSEDFQFNEQRTFCSATTGNKFPNDGHYIGTVQSNDGYYVVHVFEILNQ